jgi:cytochrome c peroxidase
MSAAKVELGRHLFFDRRLSGNGTQSCATCHDPLRAFTDGLATPIGSTGQPGRHNAMTLVNVAFNSTLTWATPIRTLEDQALVPMFGTHPLELATDEPQLLARLAADPIYTDLFARAFPAEPITITAVTYALASFERTIVSRDSPFDRFIAGDASALPTRAQRGLALFESDRLGCATCHGGFNLTVTTGDDVRFFNTGLYNVDGRGGYPTSDRGLIETTGTLTDMGRYRPPTLRNVAVTAPYLHDGSAADLDAVIDAYARGGRLISDGPNAGDGALSPYKSVFITGFTLSMEERADLLAFLSSLTDPTVLADPALQDPW